MTVILPSILVIIFPFVFFVVLCRNFTYSSTPVCNGWRHLFRYCHVLIKSLCLPYISALDMHHSATLDISHRYPVVCLVLSHLYFLPCCNQATHPAMIYPLRHTHVWRPHNVYTLWQNPNRNSLSCFCMFLSIVNIGTFWLLQYSCRFHQPNEIWLKFYVHSHLFQGKCCILVWGLCDLRDRCRWLDLRCMVLLFPAWQSHIDHCHIELALPPDKQEPNVLPNTSIYN